MSVKEVQTLTNLVVRYLLGGASFVVALGFLQDRRFHFLRVTSQGEDISLYLASLVIVVAGVTIYVLHRAIAYRLVLPALLTAFSKRRKLGLEWLQLERELTTRRLERRAENDRRQDHFDTWAAELHFLYVSAWGWLGAVAVFGLGQQTLGLRGLAMLATGVVLLLGALWHDWRMIEEEVEASTLNNAA